MRKVIILAILLALSLSVLNCQSQGYVTPDNSAGIIGPFRDNPFRVLEPVVDAVTPTQDGNVTR